MMTGTVLALNAGSSSLKAELYEIGGTALHAVRQFDDWDAVAQAVHQPVAVGHRIVFGGSRFVAPVVATGGVLAALEAFASIEPLHLPAEIALCARARARFPGAVHVLCFDTGFFAGMPAVAQALPLPPLDPMLRRYGFHGLSYEYIATQVPPGERTIAAHLGSGASVCAIRDRRPLDTTMGFTAFGGIMMATRPGDLDPGVLLYLLERRYDASKMRELLAHQSGLRGLSGRSGDIREVIAAAPEDPRAALALDLFIYDLVKAIGAMAAVLGGADRIVFTGGIGEHQPLVRERAVAALGYLGKPAIQVIPAHENLMIARHALAAAR